MSAVLASLRGGIAPPQVWRDVARHDCFVCELRGAWQKADPFSSRRATQPWLVSGHRRVRRGEALFRTGDALRHVCAVHTGQFKTISLAADGHTEVTGFHVAGDLLGLEAIGTGRHDGEAVALEDSQVCAIDAGEMLHMLSALPALQQDLWRRVGQQIARDRQTMLWLRSRRAEERVAGFLLSLLERMQRLGASSSSIVLRMTRAEIGSFLGLTLETVSRSFSHFRTLGLLDVKDRDIRVLDRRGLLLRSGRP